MVDIHCHLLPGLDDGPDSLDEALEMAEMAIEDGITHVVSTPHANDRFKFVSELVCRRRDELQERLGDRLKLATGCDLHLNFENMEDLRANPTMYTINQKNYLLVELPSYGLSPSTEDTLHQLQLIGLNPVITHPERNPLLRGNPERLEDWLRRGCYAQVTALSLLGGFGAAAQHWAETWLDQDRIHFIATDAHNVHSRRPQLHSAYELVAARRDERLARALFYDNPLAALEGRPLPYLPELGDEKASRNTPRKLPRRRRFFFF